nr:MAG TPA: hypothetical protein [Caudoviricetes sp.]
MKKLIRLKLLRKTLPLCILQGGLFLFQEFKIIPLEIPLENPRKFHGKILEHFFVPHICTT